MTDNPPDSSDRRDDAPEPVAETSVTRSEERLNVTTRRRAVARARLVGYRETETVTRTVELRHDQVRLELEPVADDDPESAPVGEDETWVVLYDEEVVVTTRRVPRERVRLRVHSVTVDHELTESLKRERVDVEVDDTLG